MKAVVTGGAGFIGANLAEMLCEEGWDVLVVDDLSRGRRENVPPQARFEKLNILDGRVVDVFREFSPDVVFHLAAQVSVSVSVEDPIFDMRVNIEGSIRVYEASALAGARAFVFASSAAVYGEPEKLPLDEGAKTAPLSPYGVSKLSFEIYLPVLYSKHGLPYSALRFSNVYGPLQFPEGEAGVVAVFMDRMVAKKPLVIFGDGEQTRDFIYVEDVARACILAAKWSAGGRCGVFNVCTGKETSVKELAYRIFEVAGYSTGLEFAPPRKGDIRRSVLSPERARKTLGWEPKVPLREGIEKTWKWHLQGEA